VDEVGLAQARPQAATKSCWCARTSGAASWRYQTSTLPRRRRSRRIFAADQPGMTRDFLPPGVSSTTWCSSESTSPRVGGRCGTVAA
jgi:hypothetical protein